MHPKSILDQYGLSAKKSLGQNFLFDDHILSRIANAAELNGGDDVLEIGPGFGSLTRHLSDAAGRVVAVEIDDRFIPILNNRLADLNNVELIQADILNFQPANFFQSSYKVVANIPYYITGAILRHLLSTTLRPSLTILTVQRDVAERLSAGPGDMSLLAVSVQLVTDVTRLFTIKAGSFWPRPDVDSQVVMLQQRKERLITLEDEARFFKLVRAGFGQKRKQLQKNLRILGYPRSVLETALEEANISGSQRAETLAIEDWVAILQALS